VVTVDLHANQIQGFFDIPVDNLYAIPSLIDALKKRITEQVVIVSPDVGGARRARYLAERWRPAANIAIIDKRRPRPGMSEVVNIIGKVRDRVAILADDMIDSGGTIVNASQALLAHGAKEVYVACTHGVFSGQAVERLQKSPIAKCFVTDTIPRPGDPETHTKFETVTLAPLIGTAIRNIHEGESVSSLFDGIDSLN
jgi:ribose-phosphate pyrophosphokinase